MASDIESRLHSPAPVLRATAVAPARSASTRTVQEMEAAVRRPLATVIICTFLVLAFSRVAELGPQRQFRLPLIFSLCALFAALMTGSLSRVLTTLVGKRLTLFSLWLLPCTFFSTWPGGSYELLSETWFKSYMLLVVVLALVESVEQIRSALYALGFAGLVAAIMALAWGATVEDGRLILPVGHLANPNDLVQVLLLCFPGWYLLGTRAKGLGRAFVLAGAVPYGVASVLTQSRAGLLTTATMLFTAMLLASGRQRLRVLAVGLAVGLAVLLLAPENVMRRLGTFLVEEQQLDDLTVAQQIAADSAAGRFELLKESLGVTIEHPVFGIGPGVYQSAAARRASSEGQRAFWHESHNAYTQVSSETGVPGFLLYYSVLLHVIWRCWRAARSSPAGPGHSDTAILARYLLLSMVAYAVTAAFSSVAYQFTFPVLAGLAAALPERT